jgi:cytochrome oxidase Cu insertion factor (SCO1/SenC/PrrC family)
MFTHKLRAAALRVAKRLSVARFGVALAFLSTIATASASNSTVNTFDETTTAVDEPGTLSLGGVGLVSILGLMLLRHQGTRIG